MEAFKISVYLMVLISVCAPHRIRYIATEHPEISWVNTKYARYVNLTATRYSRSDPFYYVGYHVDLVWPVHFNINIDFVFYEFLSNQYKRSFVEFHFEVCDMIARDGFLGIPMSKFFPRCPYASGVYHINNVTIPLVSIPANFPFTKGRIQANFTSKDTKEFLGFGHVDMELREVNARRLKKGKSLKSIN